MELMFIISLAIALFRWAMSSSIFEELGGSLEVPLKKWVVSV
jgi:hypothetical protein